MTPIERRLRAEQRIQSARRVTLDSCSKRKSPVMDSADGDMDEMAVWQMQKDALDAAGAVQQWCEGDLGEGEGSADRLLALLIGLVDVNVNGELDDDEQETFGRLANAAWDYMSSKGASEDDIKAIFDGDSEAGDRVLDLLCSVLPEGDDASMDDIHSFAFGDQSAVFDAAYKIKTAIRGGQKVRARRRVAGRVALSAAQKVAVRKMQAKSHSAAAMTKRAKSMRVRRSMGM